MAEQWQNQIYQNYINGTMSPQGRKNYEDDIATGVLPAPQGWAKAAQPFIEQGQQQIDAMEQPTIIPAEPQLAHAQETKPKMVSDDVLERFWSGDMSDEGMKNLIDDFKSGVVVAGEDEDVPIVERMKKTITGEGRRVPETEALPSWVRMPEMNNLSIKGAKSLVYTLATGADETAKVIKKQNPDVDVKKDSKGNYIFTSAMDGKRYAIKPGVRADEDLLRAAGTIMAYAAGARMGGGRPMGRILGTGATQFGIEATQEMGGADFDAMEIPIAMMFEGGGVLTGKGKDLIKGLFKGKTAPAPIRKALKKMGINLQKAPQTGKEIAVKQAQSLGVEPMTSDILPPKTFGGKVGQAATERIPIVGTGAVRVKQQEARLQAIRKVLSDYGADDLAQASDDVMKDLIKKRGNDITKYNNMKTEVIDRLSKENVSVLDMTEEEFKRNKPRGFGYSKEDYVARRDRASGKTLLTPKYFKLSREGKEQLLLHESGHDILGSGADDFNKYFADVLEPFKIGDAPLGANTKYQDFFGMGGEAYPEEVLANAFMAWKTGAYKGYEKGGKVYKLIDVIEERAKKLGIKNIEELSNKVPTNKVNAAIDTEIARLQVLDNKDVAPLIDALENSRQSFAGKSLNQIEDNRKLLGETLGSGDFTKVKSQADKVNRKIYKAVNEDMGQFIKDNGNPKDFVKWKVANKRLADGIGELKVSSLKTSLNKGTATPEEIRKLLFSNKTSDIERLYKNLTPKGKARAKVAIYQEALEKAGGLDDLSTAKFQTALKKLSKSTGVFFKGEDRKVLDGLVETLKLTKRAEVAGVAPPTGVQNFQILGALGLGALGGAKGAATAVSIGAAARAYESKAVRNLLIKIAKGGGGQDKALKALGNLLKTQHQFTKRKRSPTEPQQPIFPLRGRI